MMTNSQLKIALSKTIETIYERHGQEAIIGKKFHIGCFEFPYLGNTYYGIINLLKAPLKACHKDTSFTLIDSKFAVIDKKPEQFLLLTINNGKIKQHSNGEDSYYAIKEREIEFANILDNIKPEQNFNSNNFSSDNPNYLYCFDVSDLMDDFDIAQTGDRIIVDRKGMFSHLTRQVFPRSLLKDNIIYTNEYQFNHMRICSLKEDVKHKAVVESLKNEKAELISIVSSGLRNMDKDQLEEIKKHTMNILNNIQTQ